MYKYCICNPTPPRLTSTTKPTSQSFVCIKRWQHGTECSVCLGRQRCWIPPTLKEKKHFWNSAKHWTYFMGKKGGEDPFNPCPPYCPVENCTVGWHVNLISACIAGLWTRRSSAGFLSSLWKIHVVINRCLIFKPSGLLTLGASNFGAD